MAKRSIAVLSLVLAVLLLVQSAFPAQAAAPDTVRSDPEPVGTEPSETGPTETEPVETEPVETDPVETDPVETDPVETDPVETDPTETEPSEPAYPVLEEHPVYIHGYSSGAFCPSRGLTRAELAQILYNVYDPAPGTSGSFPDVTENAWYAPAVDALTAEGLLEGYPDGTFRPGRTVTRAEVVTVLARLFGGAEEPAEVSFPDVPGTHWAAEAVALAQQLGWVEGYPDGTFRPDRAVSRAEAVTLLNRFWGRVPDREAIDTDPELRFFPDVSPSQWFYYDVMEAATAHTARFESPEQTERWQDRVVENPGLEDGFRCVDGRLYLVLEGDFLRTEGEGLYEDVAYVCEGDTGVCTAGADALLLYNGVLVLLTEEGRPMYPLGAFPEGFYYHGGAIYASKGGDLVQKAGRSSLSGRCFTCEGFSGRCAVEGRTLPTACGDWYRLSEGAVDLTPGLFSYVEGMYCVQDDGTLLRNGAWNGLRFGADAKYTSGNAVIDAEIERIIAQVTDDGMDPDEKLFACYEYVFSVGLNYRAYNHVPKGQDCSQWAEPYMLKYLEWNGKGNCYCFASLYYYLCRRTGWWQAKAVSGSMFYAGYDHGWVEIPMDGTRYLFDPRTDARYNKDKAPGALYRKTYDNAPYLYFPPD